ncbi:prepilin peptidase [Actinospongicola halichondriae]|uniref:prepilin peptidase n=1 Tax=Actinospongicola halichondriae TaxID=3236844 RepID=UPI003D40B155
MDVAPILAGLVGLPVGSYLNRLVVREPGYVITDPGDLPDDADPALLDELEAVPELPDPVPFLALVRPRTWWRWWFPATEVVTAGLFALAVHRVGTGWPIIPVLFLVAALVTLSAVDLRVYRIPDRVNFPSMAIGLALLVATSLVRGEWELAVAAVVGGLTYATMLFLAHIAYPRGMGWGDVKLAWLMGFHVGWASWDGGSLVEQYLYVLRGIILAFGIGSLLGAVFGLTYALARRSAKAVFPYGPSLAIGCLVVVLWAPELS